ncbi:unnamed protein product [Cuscuta epithymum]|uniref:Uncharacterized protein n=1 Tax=Cuscuta epithymum TaxID=186058 RepID=A0AAV0DVC4_9ASTE|nr:unnamed protein product [Cuscuta epithymum]
MFQHRETKRLRWRRGGAAGGRPEGALRGVRREEQNETHRPDLVSQPPGVPVPPPVRRGGVRVRPRHGHHYPLRGGRFPVTNFHAQIG